MADGNPFDRFDTSTQGGSNPFDTFDVPSRPNEFNPDPTQPARMTNAPKGTRPVPKESPAQRIIYDAGGAATEGLAKLGVPAEVAAAGGYATNLAGQIGTTFLGGGIGKAAGEPVVQAAGRFLMKNALRPSPTVVKSGDAARSINAMLEQGISVSKGGAEKAASKIDELKNTLDTLSANAQGDVYVIKALQPSLDKIKELKTASGGLDWKEKITAVQTEIADLLDNPAFRNKFKVPVATANEMKRAIYKEIGDTAFKTGFKPGSVKEAKEGIAYGLKGEIEKSVPEAKGLNKEMGDLIEASKLIESRLGRQGASAPVSPWTMLFALKHPTLAAAHFAENNPQISSSLARAAYSSGLPTKAGLGIGGAVGAYEGSAPLYQRRLSDNQ